MTPPDFPPLDDLLPENDAHYEPPANLAELFTDNNSSLWALADIYKFGHIAHDPNFKLGYYANIIDTWLKTGQPFLITVETSMLPTLTDRIQQFQRK